MLEFDDIRDVAVGIPKPLRRAWVMAVGLQYNNDSGSPSKPWWEALVGMRSLSNIDSLRSQLIFPGEYGVSHWYDSSASDEFLGSETLLPSGQLSAWSQSEYSFSDTSRTKSATMRDELQDQPSSTVDDDSSTIALSKHASQLTISQDVDESIADILYTPMTGTSSVYSRPEELPPGVNDAIGIYRKGQWSTTQVQLEQLPSPLVAALTEPKPDIQGADTVEEPYDNSFIIGNEKERELNSSKSAQPWSSDMPCDSGVALFSPRSPPRMVQEHRADTLETRSMSASLHQPSIEKLPVMLEKPLPKLPTPKELQRSAPPIRNLMASCPPPISIPPPIPLRNPYRLNPKTQATKSLIPQPVKSQLHPKRSVQTLVLAPKVPPITRPNLEPLSAIGAPSTPRTPGCGLTYEAALKVPWVENNLNRQAPLPACESLAHHTQDSIASAKSFLSASLPAAPPSTYLCSSGASSPTLGYSSPKIQSASIPSRSIRRHPSLDQQPSFSSPEFDNSDSAWLREKPSLRYEPRRRRWLGYEDAAKDQISIPSSSNSWWSKSDKVLGLNTLPHSKSMVINRERPLNVARQRTFPIKSISHLASRKNDSYVDKEILSELPLNNPISKSPLFSPGSEKSLGVSTVTPSSIFSTSETAAESSTNTSPSNDVFSPGLHPAMRFKKRTSSMLTIGSFDTNLSENQEPTVDTIIPTLYGKRKTSDAGTGETSGSKMKELGFFKKLALNIGLRRA